VLPLLLPGLIALPVYTLTPHLGGKGVPFSKAGEEAKSARRGLDFIVVTFISIGMSAVATWSWEAGWFRWLLLAETILAIVIFVLMRASLASMRWPSME
jgi:hypothetical protein